MSLINCPECNKEISDQAKACINCGHPIKNKNPPITVTKSDDNIGINSLNSFKEEGKSYEDQIYMAVDVIFAILYIYLFYKLFFGGNSIAMDSIGSFIGLLLGFTFIYFVQKMSKAILGTIARSFDGAVNKND